MSEEGRELAATLARFMSGERPPVPETDPRELARAVQRVKQSLDLNASGSPLPRVPREHPRDLARAVEDYRKKAAGLLQDVSHVQGNDGTTAATEDFRGGDDWMLPPLASSGADAQPLHDENAERVRRQAQLGMMNERNRTRLWKDSISGDEVISESKPWDGDWHDRGPWSAFSYRASPIPNERNSGDFGVPHHMRHGGTIPTAIIDGPLNLWALGRGAWEGEPGMFDQNGLPTRRTAERAFDAAGAMGTGGLAATPLKPRGAIGIFGGRNAKTANLEKLAQAERMAAEGADPRAIWNETGWFRGADGKWRFEIDDSASRMTGVLDRRAEEAMTHEDLYAAYPHLRNMPVQRWAPSRPSDEGVQGWSTPSRIGLRGTSDEDRLAMLHELQHKVQAAEDFARGGSMRSPEVIKAAAAAMAKREAELIAAIRPIKAERDAFIRKWIDAGDSPLEAGRLVAEFWRLNPDLGRRWNDIIGKMATLRGATEDYRFKAYQSLPGEVEARAVAERADMSASRRAMEPPFSIGPPFAP